MKIQLLTLAAVMAAGALSAVQQEIPIAGENWSLRLDAPALGERREQREQDQYVLEGRAGDLNLSVFVETPANDGRTHRDCFGYYWPKGARNPLIDRNSVKITHGERFSRVEYRIAAGAYAAMTNVNYYLCYGGKWVDVHISCDAADPAAGALLKAFDSGLACAPLPAAGRLLPGQIERRVVLPGRGSLVLVIPATWNSVVAWPPRDLPPTLQLTPPDGDAFKMLLTPIWNPAAHTPMDASKVREVATQAMAKVQEQAVETLALSPWAGAKAKGFYYAATDKAPAPGEYPYMLQAIGGMDDVLLSVTVLLRNKPSDEAPRFLDILQRLRLEPKGTGT